MIKILFSIDKIDILDKKACIKTSELLASCKDAGYTIISINKQTNLIPASLCRVFDSIGNIFAYPETARIGGWPAIWRVTERHNVSYGCGNSHQHQIHPRLLTTGVYQLINQTWKKIE